MNACRPISRSSGSSSAQLRRSRLARLTRFVSLPVRRLRQSLLFSLFLAYCCLASGTEYVDHDTSVDDRVRASLDIPNEDTLNEARFNDALLKRFPLGTSWSEAEAKIRRLVFPYRVTRDARRVSTNLYNRERHIQCEVAENVGFIGCSFFSDPKIAAISLNDRSWHFEMRFGAKKSLQHVHSQLVSSPCWNSPYLSEACLKKSIDDCQSKGGIWYGHVWGRGRDTGCNLPTKDAGKPCTSKNQCEGTCIPASGSNPNSIRCICDSRMWQPKGLREFCTEDGVQRIEAE